METPAFIRYQALEDVNFLNLPCTSANWQIENSAHLNLELGLNMPGGMCEVEAVRDE